MSLFEAVTTKPGLGGGGGLVGLEKCVCVRVCVCVFSCL